jgi:hypothetical protein
MVDPPSEFKTIARNSPAAYAECMTPAAAVWTVYVVAQVAQYCLRSHQRGSDPRARHAQLVDTCRSACACPWAASARSLSVVTVCQRSAAESLQQGVKVVVRPLPKLPVGCGLRASYRCSGCGIASTFCPCFMAAKTLPGVYRSTGVEAGACCSGWGLNIAGSAGTGGTEVCPNMPGACM